MNEQEREMDLALAECEAENRLLRARNERLMKEVDLLTEALRGKQEQGEPVAWMDLLKEAEQIVKDKFFYKRFIDGTPLANNIPCWMADFAQKYTTPQQRTWVGLTDEDYVEMGLSLSLIEWQHKAIEAKLKEKNT